MNININMNESYPFQTLGLITDVPDITSSCLAITDYNPGGSRITDCDLYRAFKVERFEKNLSGAFSTNRAFQK